MKSLSSTFQNLNNIKLIAFDFDGVFTDNRVWMNSMGDEFVCCSRADGLALDMVRGARLSHDWGVELRVFSTESNDVVLARAEKLHIGVSRNIKNKLNSLKNFASQIESCDLDRNVIFLGNDLNDLDCMMNVAYSVAPCDAHDSIKRIASLVLPVPGGNGFVRAFIEKLFSEFFINPEKIYESLSNS